VEQGVEDLLTVVSLVKNQITSFLGIDGGLFVNKCHIFNGVRFEETPSANYRKTRDSMLSFKRHDNFVPSGSSTRLFCVHHLGVIFFLWPGLQ